MVLPAAWTRVTRNFPSANGDVTLSARVWALLEDAYKAVGLDPKKFLIVTQGSWHHGSESGSTHNGGGAFDLRVWNLPASKVVPLVVELRRRNVCAWKRDKAHGGFDPHIHGIVRDEPALASGAAWQVAEYDRVNDGLADRRPDYHPRPVQAKFVYPPLAAVPGKVVHLADLQDQDKVPSSTSALIVNDALIAEKVLEPALRRAYWSDAAQKAFRVFRNNGKYPSNLAAFQALGRRHGFTVI